jgi:predicted alpha/beta superfamily hydrolase
MSKHTIQKMIAVVAFSCIGLISASAIAGQDSFQLDMTQRIQQGKLKLQQAQAAKGAEHKKLMAEHMQMMKEDMDKCRTMKPKEGLSEKEREEWYIEHQKIMQEIMDQMMQENQMMHKMEDMPMDSGDAHKH